MLKRATFRSLSLLFLVILLPALLVAQEPEEPSTDPFYTKGERVPLSSITERVDPFSGNLTLVQRDIHLPGNGGLDVDIIRTYSSALWGRRDITFPGLVALNENSPIDLGWSLHMGIVRNPWGTGSANRLQPDNPVVEMHDGSKHPLYRDKNDSTWFISTSFWLYQNIGAGTWKLILTDGTTYIFAFNTEAGYTTDDGMEVAQVTQIQHANGVATINIFYDKQNGYSYLDRIQDSTGRWIYFHYDVIKHQLISIDVAGITYQYTYQTVTALGPNEHVLHKAIPPVGNPWTYTYHPSTHEITSLTYPQGGIISYDYDDIWFDTGTINVRFRVVTQRQTSGRDISPGTWTYQYNSGAASGDQTTIDAPDGITEVHKHHGWGNSGIGNVWRIGLPISQKIYKNSTLIYEEQNTWDKSSTISFDDVANANWSHTGGAVYDVDIRVPLLTAKTITRDGSTYTTQYSNYDAYGNPDTITESGDTTRTTTRSYWYNTTKNIVHNRPSSETVTGSGSFQGTFTTTFSYNSNGSLTQRNRYGVTIDYTYYSNGNLHKKTDANNKITTYTWTYGVVSHISNPEYSISRVIDADSTVASETNGRGHTTSFTYDDNLRLTKITLPLGNSTTFSYPADSSHTKETRGIFYVFTYFDGFGRPTGTSDRKGVDTDMEYTAYGRKKQTDSEIGDKEEYDDFERVKKVVHKDATSVTYAYAGSDVTVTNETGDTTTFISHAFGDPDDKYLLQVNDARGHVTSYDRDILGQLLSIHNGSWTRSFGYSAKAFLTSETQNETGFISYGRDNIGNLTSRTDAVGTRSFTYDGINRLTAIQSGSNTISFGYDGANNRTSMDAPNAQVSYTYDSANRLTQKQVTTAGMMYSTTYAYDGNDNLTAIVYPTGQQVTYDYDANNELTLVAWFDGTVDSFLYNLAGQATAFAYANGTSTQLLYTSRYLPQRITAAGVLDLGYAYDPRGNTKTITNYLDSTTSQSFGYDALDRLTSFSGAWGSGTLSYNEHGNRTAKAFPGFNATYAYSNQRLSSIGGTAPEVYTYRANGDVKTRRKGGTTYTFTYNGFGHLIDYATGGTSLVAFASDGDGRRVQKITSAQTTVYHYDEVGRILAETDAQGQLLAEYIYANGILVAKRALDTSGSGGGSSPVQLHIRAGGSNLTWGSTHIGSGAGPCGEILGTVHIVAGGPPAPPCPPPPTGSAVLLSFYHTDALGTPMAMTDDTGQVVWQADYLPFGEPFTTTTNPANATLFVGKQLDSETDLYDFGARYLAANVGRFLTPDAVRAVDPATSEENDTVTRNPQRLNLYAYGLNNPYRYVDPDGNIVWDVIDVGFFGYSLYKFIKNPSVSTGIDVALDGLGVLPLVPALGTIRRVGQEAIETGGGLIAKGATGPDFIVGSNGTAIATSQSRMRKGFNDAGFPSQNVISPTSGKVVGQAHTLPDGNIVRTMSADGRNLRRASFTNTHGKPIDPFTGKPPQPPTGLSRTQRKQFVRGRSHIIQGP